MMMRMDITEYVDALRRDLAQAARAMGPETEQAAERIGSLSTPRPASP